MVTVDTFKMQVLRAKALGPSLQSRGWARLALPAPSAAQSPGQGGDRDRSCWLHSLLLKSFPHRNVHDHAQQPWEMPG